MAISRKQFIKHLTRSDVMSQEDVAAFLETLPQPPADGEQLAKALIKARRLTQFQAQRIYQGKYQGLRLGEYLILDTIGAGGMGQVYLAEHRRMRRRVALKTLPAAVAKDESTVRRFHREVRAAAKLSHPNIVTAFDAGEDKGIHYFVMEQVEGIDLARLVRETGKLSITDGIDFTLQAARGLAYAHRQGIVHRDIKPSNLLIDKQRTVKVLDMGLARIETEADGVTGVELTQTGTVMGTVDYMAPEQALDTKHADARSDIYSLGCSLYFLLTGRTVFGGDTVVKKIFAHRDAPIPALCEARPSLPTAAGKVFERMLAKNPDHRYQSMEDVVTALETCGVLEPSTVGPAAVTNEPGYDKFLLNLEVAETPTMLEPPQKQKRSGEHETVPSGVLDETLVGGIGEKQRLSRRPPQLPPWWHNRWVMGGGAAALLLLVGILITITRPDGTQTTVNVPEGSDVAIDGKGNVNVKLPGTAAGATAGLSSSAGAGNHALLFDGVDDVVGVPTLQFSGSQVLTIETTVRLLSPEREPKSWMTALIGGGLLTIRHFSSPSSHFWEAYGVQASNGQYVQQSVHLDQTGTVHLAAVYDGRRITTFANGKRSAQALRQLVDDELKAASEIAGLMNQAGLFTFIGSEGTTRYLHGVIDEVRISNVARYTADFTPQARFEPDEYTLALYHFDEAEGTILHDSSGNGHHGKIVGAKWVRVDDQLNVLDEPPPANHALLFDGVEDYVMVPVNQNGDHPVTIEALVRPYSIDLEAKVITSDALKIHVGAQPYWQIYAYDMTNASASFGGVPAISDELVHVAGVWDGSSLRMYVNGELAPNVHSPLSSLRSGTEYYIGATRTNSETKNGFHGIIDEVRISNTARYKDDFTPAERFENDEHTLALYHFDDAQGTMLTDTSGNGHHGTMHGATWVRVDEQLNVLDESAANATPVDPERAAAELVLGLGGTIRIFHPNTSDIADISSVEELPPDRFAVFVIDLNKNPKVRDEHLKAFGQLRALQVLTLSDTAITDRGVSYLSPLTSLKALALVRTQVTSASVSTLCHLTRLTFLNLNDTSVVDQNLSLLAKLPCLRELHLGGTRLTDEGLQELAMCLNLNVLAIHGTQFRSESLEPLSELPSLQTLNVAYTHLDDGDVEVLTKFPQLTLLYLYETSLSEAGVRQLRQALPRCFIQADHSMVEESEIDVARNILGVQGTVSIRGRGAARSILAPDQLPSDGFGIKTVELPPNARLEQLSLTDLKSVEGLFCSATPDSMQSALLIAELRSLNTLHFEQNAVSAKVLKKLAELPNLDQLYLSQCRGLDDPSLAVLTPLAHLSLLNLVETDIHGSGFEHLSKLQELQHLSLDRCLLTHSEGIAELARLPYLRELHLRGCGLGDDALPYLKQLTACRVLFLNGNPITPAAVHELQAALPDCVVFHEALKDVPVPPRDIPPASQNHALSFDGIDDYVAIPTLKLDGSHPVTVEVTVRLISELPLGTQANAIFAGGLLQFQAYGGESGSITPYWQIQGRIDSDNTLAHRGGNQDGPLARLAAVYDGQGITLYINGVASQQPQRTWNSEVGGTELKQQVVSLVNQLDIATWIGCSKPTFDKPDWFHGIIDEVRISNTARYTEDFTPKLRLEADKHTLALYHFDEAEGTILHDASGNGHDGTIHGATWVRVNEQLNVIDEPPPANHALQFDGQDDYVEIPGLVSQGHDEEFTFELFVRPTSAPTTSSFPIVTLNGMRLEATAPDRWRIFGKQLDDFTKAQAARFRLEEADHLAVVVSNGEVALFANGRFIGKTPAPRPQGIAIHCLGGNTPQSEYFHGLIDEVRISNVARYTEDFTPQARLETDEHTLALYHFDEAEGTILHDASGNGHDGTIHGATWVRVDDELNVLDEPPPANHALSFDGQDDYVAIPTLKLDGSHPVTVEATVRLLSEPEPNLGMIAVNAGGLLILDRFRGQAADGHWQTYGYDSTDRQQVFQAADFDPDKSVHLAAVYDLKQITLFINGQRSTLPLRKHDKDSGKFETVTVINGLVRRWSSLATILGVGDQGNEKLSRFHGLIDEVRISGVARYTEDYTPQTRLEPDEHTLALYHFDEAEGNILHDASGNGHHGTIHGATWVRVDEELNVLDEPPPANHALSFDGQDDYIEVPTLTLDGSHPVTVEATVRLLSGQESMSEVALVNGGGLLTIKRFRPDNGDSYWQVRGNDGADRQAVFQAAEADTLELVHLAAVYDLQRMTIFVNGRRSSFSMRLISDGKIEDLERIAKLINAWDAITYIGTGVSTAADFKTNLHGIIDEVRISNVARYTEDFTPQARFEPDEHTLALYHFDEAEGTILHDTSGNGHHGTIHGATWVRVDDQLNVIDEAGAEATPLRSSASSVVPSEGGDKGSTTEGHGETTARPGKPAVEPESPDEPATPDGPAQPMNEAASPAPAPPAPDSQPAPPTTGKVIQVGPGEEMVKTLGEAFAQAEGGDTIEICQDEPLAVDGSKTNWTKPGGLTIRNGEGFQPVLIQTNSNTNNLIAIRKSESDNQPLQLLGLTFVDLVNDRTGTMVYAEPGAVANRCLFVSRRAYSISGGYTAMGDVELRECYLWRPWHPDASALAHCFSELQLSNCLLAGDGSLGLREENRTSVSSTSFVGTRHAFGVTGTTHLNSERNLFANLNYVISFWPLDDGDIKTAKSLLPSYSGQSNLYFNCNRFAPDLAPKTAADLAVWQQFTGNGEKSPVLADPQFARPDLVAQCRQRLLPPSAFRLKPTSPARRRNIGCDVSKLPDLPPALIDLLPPDMRPSE